LAYIAVLKAGAGAAEIQGRSSRISNKNRSARCGAPP
jgi:hypothetical protein